MNEAKKQTTDPAIALLAPVPLEHLESALDILKVKDWVAFGSMAFDVFDRLDKHRGDSHVDAYIYASLHDGSEASQYWRGTYIGMSRESEVSEHRPESTISDTKWGFFWRVRDLIMVTPGEWRIDKMQGFEKKTMYKKFFIPQGPILIKHP